MNKEEFIQEYFVWAQQVTTDFEAATLDFTLVTNQGNGIASFASSRNMNLAAVATDRRLVYKRSYQEGIYTRLHHFRVDCEYYFSDRLHDMGEPYGPGSHIPTGPMQPFAVRQEDKITLILYATGTNDIFLHIDLLTWQSSFEVPMELVDDMLFGIGTPVGNAAPNAIYVLSLHNKSTQKVY